MADGRSNRQIATDLSLSLTTVHKHINAVYRKLGVDSRRTVSSAPAAPPPPEPTADASPAPAKPAATESAPAPVASGGSHGHGTIRLRGTPEPAPVAAAAAPPIAPGTVTTADVERLAAEAKAAWAAYQSLSRSPDWQQKSMEMAAAAVRATALELAKRSLG